MEYTVGMPLWSSLGKSTVKAVGRKWVTLDNGRRIEKDTGNIEQLRCGSFLGVVYASKDDYDETTARKRAWSEVRIVISSKHSPPNHLSSAEIDDIIRKVSG